MQGHVRSVKTMKTKPNPMTMDRADAIMCGNKKGTLRDWKAITAFAWEKCAMALARANMLQARLDRTWRRWFWAGI